MSVLSSSLKRRRRVPSKLKFKTMGNHDEFLSRIKKTLYYGKIPLTERFSLPVSELAAEIFTEVKAGRSLEKLCVEEAAGISRSACVSPCSLILALFYLDRLKTCNPDYLEKASPSELFIVSMMVASKFLHDDGEEDEVFNDEWATSAGISRKEMNCYEKNFLKAIKWEVFVNEETFWTGLKEMEREVARREGRRRGWFSYTELEALLDCVDAWSLAHTLVLVSFVCLTSYTASIFTLFGSAAIASRLPGHHLNPMSRIASSMPANTIPESAPMPASTSSSRDEYTSLVIDTCLRDNLTCIRNNDLDERPSETVGWRSLWLTSWFDVLPDVAQNHSDYERYDDSDYLYDGDFDDLLMNLHEEMNANMMNGETDRNENIRNLSPSYGRRSSVGWLTDVLYEALSPIKDPSAMVFPIDLTVSQ